MPQTALDETPLRAEIEMTPTLNAVIVRAYPPPGLTAAPAYPTLAPEPNGHDHPLHPEADIDHRRAGKAQKPVECSGDGLGEPCRTSWR